MRMRAKELAWGPRHATVTPEGKPGPFRHGKILPGMEFEFDEAHGWPPGEPPSWAEPVEDGPEAPPAVTSEAPAPEPEKKARGRRKPPRFTEESTGPDTTT